MSEAKDLFPPAEPRWLVLTCYRHQTKLERIAKKPREVSHHELLFGDSVLSRRKGETGLETLREIARFLNSKNLRPRKKIECCADAPNAESYLKKIALLHAAKICAPMVSAFDKTMADVYAEKLTRPRLKKITFTILF